MQYSEGARSKLYRDTLELIRPSAPQSQLATALISAELRPLLLCSHQVAMPSTAKPSGSYRSSNGVTLKVAKKVSRPKTTPPAGKGKPTKKLPPPASSSKAAKEESEDEGEEEEDEDDEDKVDAEPPKKKGKKGKKFVESKVRSKG